MKIIKKIVDHASLVITLFIMVIFAVMMFAVIKGVNNWRDPQVWIEMGFCTFLQVVMIFTWLPEGKKRGAEDETYKTNRKEANDKRKAVVDAENLDRLARFCKYATSQNIKAWIAKKVGRYGVVYEQWYCKDDKGEQIPNETYRKDFDAKIINRVRNVEMKAPDQVREIKPSEIIISTEVNLVYDTVDHSRSAERIKVALKMTTSLLISTIGAFIAFEGAKFSVEGLLQFLYWCFVMAMTIFFSLRTGMQLMTKYRNDYFKRIIDFLNHFETWHEDINTD
ncbi:MAG: hypothetical protein J1G02_06625 [Clostridiales bacterium]|nr:hypothetical protein [Clostridiales bacterium]